MIQFKMIGDEVIPNTYIHVFLTAPMTSIKFVFDLHNLRCVVLI